MNASPPTTGIVLYDKTARKAASTVIAGYSTSFGLACRLLGRRVRPHVRNIYALVRVADEIVDGPAAEAGLSESARLETLNEFEAATYQGIDAGFSTNLIIHAFAQTARECGIDREIIEPFFSSMRTDINTTAHDALSHSVYVYGSAEVVGLMCVRVFVNAGRPQPVRPDKALDAGAQKLGSAFQNVNFLRDLPIDSQLLGRDYLGVTEGRSSRSEVLDSIENDLAAAAATIPLLPADCQRAVVAAHDLFAALTQRLQRTGPTSERVRVPNPEKALIAVRALVGRPARKVSA